MANDGMQIINNADKIIEAFNKQVKLGLKAIGLKAEGYAKADCPVKTGRLKNSISNAIQEDGVYIGTNVEYAPYVEYREDLRHDPPEYGGGKAHFLRDAATTHGDEYKQTMEDALKK